MSLFIIYCLLFTLVHNLITTFISTVAFLVRAVCGNNQMSNCPSTSKRKRKLQTTGDSKKPAKKKMAWDSHTSIIDFGYEFNEEGRLVTIDDGDGFNFYVSDDHWYNQENYEMLGEVITEYVYELLESADVGLKRMEIPLDKGSSPLPLKKQDKKSAKGFIFVSEDFDKKEKLLILVHGSGVVRAGQWARRLIINDCLDHGTQIPYIKKAIKEGYGVVVTNTNQNEVVVEENGKKKYKTIKESESPEKHYSYVWKNIIEKTQASKMFLVGHSYGGYLIVEYFSRNPKVLDRVVAVAFTDSVHNLNSHSRSQVKKWFLENSVNWATSNLDVDTPLQYQDSDSHVTRRSAGTTKHEESSWKAMECVFRYFKEKEIERDRNLKEEKKSGKGKAGGRKKKEIAAKFNQGNKESNKEGATLLSLHLSNCKEAATSKEHAVTEDEENPAGNPETGEKHENMNYYVEGAQKNSENSESTSEEQVNGIDKKEETSDEASSDQGEMKAATETKDKASDDVKPTNKDQAIHATFVSSTPSGDNQTTTPDETMTQKEKGLEVNDDRSGDNPQDSEMNADHGKQTASNPEDTSSLEQVERIEVKAGYIKDISGTASSTNNNLNKKEGIKNTDDSEQKETNTKTNTDEISDGISSSNTEQPDSCTGLTTDKHAEDNKANTQQPDSEIISMHEAANNKDTSCTGLSTDEQEEGNKANTIEKKLDETSKLKPTSTDKHEEDVKKSEDVHTNEVIIPINSSKPGEIVDEKSPEKDQAITDHSSTKSE